MTKNLKNLQLTSKIYSFFKSKIAIYLSPKDFQATQMPSALKREHPALQNM
jgi:hypothetical protein